MIENVSRYKRLFTFGCSFTRYLYPTWADVLSTEMSNAELYNLGVSGAGNSYIAWKITEANNKFKFNKDDLIIVMYTTFCREDRYVDSWRLHGNVYNNSYYKEDFYKYTDPNGYAIQNVAMVDLSMKYLKGLPSTSIFLQGMPFTHGEVYKDVYDDEIITRLKDTYTDVFNLPVSYFSYTNPDMRNSRLFGRNGITYERTAGEMFEDAHPAPVYAYNYLKYLGFPLTQVSYNYAVEETKYCKEIATFDGIIARYMEYNLRLNKKIEGMF